MQTHYFDLKAIPQEDSTQPQVISDIMQILHRYLPGYNNSDCEEEQIALSFPCYRRNGSLGGIIRLHGEEEQLFDLHDSLISLSGYALVGDVQEVPAQIKGYAIFSRKQYKGAAAARRMKARYAQRKDKAWTTELATAMIKKYSSHDFLPFAQLKSASTGQLMRLYIEKKEVSKDSCGFFTGYGLSKPTKGDAPLATVPIF